MKVRALGQTSDPDQEVAIAGVLIAPGVVALLNVTATKTVTATAAAAGSLMLLAANANRLAATARNDATTNLHVDAAAIVQGPPAGEFLVAPGQTVEVNESNKGALYGWFEGSPTGQVTVTEIT